MLFCIVLFTLAFHTITPPTSTGFSPENVLLVIRLLVGLLEKI